MTVMSEPAGASAVEPCAPACAEPRRGRPRSADADVAILEAALALAGELGVRALSMDEIAARAGVSKATIYRRWSSKEELVLDALRSAIEPVDAVDNGSLGADLRQYLREMTERMTASRGDVLPHLIEVACYDPSIRTSLDDWVQHRRAPLHAILQRGVARGELPADTDVDLLLDALIGPFVYRRLLTGGPIDDLVVERLLALVLPTV
jgi:AcrR family transcriptional regulator